MFALFFNLYLAMFTGTWQAYDLTDIRIILKPISNEVGTFLTSIFGDNQQTNFGDVLFSTTQVGYSYVQNWMGLVAFVLALITSIGIVAMAIKGVKKAFGIFFMGVNRL